MCVQAGQSEVAQEAHLQRSIQTPAQGSRDVPGVASEVPTTRRLAKRLFDETDDSQRPIPMVEEVLSEDEQLEDTQTIPGVSEADRQEDNLATKELHVPGGTLIVEPTPTQAARCEGADITLIPSETMNLLSGAAVNTPFEVRVHDTGAISTPSEIFSQPFSQSAFSHLDESLLSTRSDSLPLAKPRKAKSSKLPVAPLATNPFSNASSGGSSERANSTGAMERISTPTKNTWGGAPVDKPAASAGPYAGTTPPGRAVPARAPWADEEMADQAAIDPYQTAPDE